MTEVRRESIGDLSKNWHFHGKSWHILVHVHLIGKIILDSCSPAKNNPKKGFSKEKKILVPIFFMIT